mgnify:CR=1 FL=1
MVLRRKKEKKNYLGWIIIIVMVSSVFGVMFGSYTNPNQKMEYKDHAFDDVFPK